MWFPQGRLWDTQSIGGPHDVVDPPDPRCILLGLSSKLELVSANGTTAEA